MGALMDTPLVKSPAHIQMNATCEPSIPGRPNTPGYEVNRVMGDVAFDRKIAQLWAAHKRERAYLQAHP